MAYSKTIMVGNLTRDPELRVTKTGKSVCAFSIAVKRKMQDETDFWDCTAWGKTGEAISKHFHKGKEILVEGEMQKRSYTDKDGNKRWTAELSVDTFTFVGRKSDGNSGGYGGGHADPLDQFEELEDDEGLPF